MVEFWVSCLFCFFAEEPDRDVIRHPEPLVRPHSYLPYPLPLTLKREQTSVQCSVQDGLVFLELGPSCRPKHSELIRRRHNHSQVWESVWRYLCIVLTSHLPPSCCGTKGARWELFLWVSLAVREELRPSPVLPVSSLCLHPASEPLQSPAG